MFVRVVAAGICYDARSNDRTACAQPREIPSQCSNMKSQISFSHCRAQAYIFDFVFERGKGTAIYQVYRIYNYTNNVVYIKYINNSFSNNLQTFIRSVRFPKSSVGSLPDAQFCVFGICRQTNNAVYIKYMNYIQV